MKRILSPVFILVSFLLISCSSSSVYGTYQGTLPAADCPGIITSLVLHSDMTYELNSIYIDRNGEGDHSSGVFKKVNDQLIVLIRPSSGGKIYYKIQKNAVALSDSTGSVNHGELAEFYILKKTK